MIGLLSGVAGIFYEKTKDSEKEILYSTIMLQSSIVICGLILISLLLTSSLTNLSIGVDKKITYYTFGLMSLILFSIIEGIYFYFIYKKDKKNLLLFSIVLSTMLIARTIGTLVTPFQGYFAGFSQNYLVSLLSFTLHSSYVVPLESLISYFFVKMILDFNVLY